MTDACFENELWINAYNNQIYGYRFGAPQRIHFQPIIVVNRNADGSIDRKLTLDSPAYKFSDEQRELLLA